MPTELAGIPAREKESTSEKPLHGLSSVSHVLVFGDLVDKYWYLCEDVLTEGIDPLMGDQGIREVYELIKGFEAQLWLFMLEENLEIAVVTRIISGGDAGMICVIFLAGGHKIHECLNYILGVIETWAKKQNCTYVAIVGRKGWTRVCNPHGYHEISRMIRKRIGEVN